MATNVREIAFPVLICPSLVTFLALLLQGPPKAGVARQRAGPISLGISPRACTILSKLLLLLLLLLSVVLASSVTTGNKLLQDE